MHSFSWSTEELDDTPCIISKFDESKLDYHENVLSTIGNTPMVRLNSVTQNYKPKILAKLEFMNPGGSIKDRVGLAMVLDAEKKGLVKRGWTIVEPTSGNTGIGIALAGIVLGYKVLVTMPDKMSKEKQRMLQAYGVKVVVCPTDRAPEHPEHYIQVAKRLARELPDAYMPNQYSNSANPQVHYETTGKEIWKQTDGKITHLVAGMGTGGTISGISRFLKEQTPSVKVIGVEPEGSVLGGLKRRETIIPHQYKTEGIGEDFLPETMSLDLVDDIVRVTDVEALTMTRRLAREEGLLCGSSSGAAVVGSLHVANELSENDLLVTILPDSGDRYLSKLFDDDWMKSQGFL